SWIRKTSFSLPTTAVEMRWSRARRDSAEDDGDGVATGFFVRGCQNRFIFIWSSRSEGRLTPACTCDKVTACGPHLLTPHHAPHDQCLMLEWPFANWSGGLGVRSERQSVPAGTYGSPTPSFLKTVTPE